MSYSAAEVKHSNPVSDNNAAFSQDTSSNASTRRRAIVLVEKSSKTGWLTHRGEDGASIDKLIYSGKDLSHSISGETVLERSRDAHLKKGIVAASVPLKRRKAINKQLKPTSQVVPCSVMKNLLLLAAMLCLCLLIWRWTTGAGRDDNLSFAAFNFDGRISEVELSLQEAVKKLRVQLEVVDKKIGSEIGLLKSEVNKQIDEGGTFISNELKNLKDRTDDLALSLVQLKDMNLLFKDEFGKFWSELKMTSIDLDQIRALARDIVRKEIEKHAADGLGKIDYALASGGARVLKHSAPYIVGKPNSWLAIAKVKSNFHSNAQKMLEPSFGEPGQCFALLGSSGFVEIRLRTEIIPEAVTLEHVPKSVAYDRSSAPKDCRVSGWFEGPDDDPSLRADKMVALVEFTYDLQKSNAQSFKIPTADAGGIINMVRLDFTSNHGSSALTCIYRFRVHGHEPDSMPNVAK